MKVLVKGTFISLSLFFHKMPESLTSVDAKIWNSGSDYIVLNSACGIIMIALVFSVDVTLTNQMALTPLCHHDCCSKAWRAVIVQMFHYSDPLAK